MSVISCWQWWKRSFSGHGAQERALSRIAEYPDWRRTCYCVVSGFDDCYEVDHAGRVERCQEPMAATAGPAPHSFEENSLEDELRFRCAPAKYLWLTRRKSIAFGLGQVLGKHVVPEYGPEWTAANRHGR